MNEFITGILLGSMLGFFIYQYKKWMIFYTYYNSANR